VLHESRFRLLLFISCVMFTEAKGDSSHGGGSGFAGFCEVKGSTVDRTGMKIQDTALPGYFSEWEASRKVSFHLLVFVWLWLPEDTLVC
jgi:hypothetical protein